MIVTWSRFLQVKRDELKAELSFFRGGECARGGRNRGVEAAAQRAACAQFLGRLIPVFKLVRGGDTLGQQKQDQDGRPEQSGRMVRRQFHGA